MNKLVIYHVPSVAGSSRVLCPKEQQMKLPVRHKRWFGFTATGLVWQPSHQTLSNDMFKRTCHAQDSSPPLPWLSPWRFKMMPWSLSDWQQDRTWIFGTSFARVDPFAQLPGMQLLLLWSAAMSWRSRLNDIRRIRMLRLHLSANNLQQSTAIYWCIQAFTVGFQKFPKQITIRCNRHFGKLLFAALAKTRRRLAAVENAFWMNSVYSVRLQKWRKNWEKAVYTCLHLRTH